MSAFIPNTTITIQRDNTTDPGTGTVVEGYGPNLSNWTPVATGAPAYVYEDSQSTWDPAAGRKTIREITVVRFRPDAPVQDRDRLVDELQDGVMYQVDSITREASVVGLADIRCSCIRITA
jgi:Phage head-tail joining protein